LKRIAVIGAGISGLSIANLLQENKYKVTVYEQKDKPGGLVSCDRIDGVLFHKVGGHVFNSKNKMVLDWFWSKFDRQNEFVEAKRNAKILLQNKLVSYPIENYLNTVDSVTAEQIIEELKSKKKPLYNNPFDYPNFECFLKDNFGEYLYELYFKPYNQKIWKTDLTLVPMYWLEGKLPMPNIQEIITNFYNPKEESNMVHSTFFYPKEGGSQFIADRLTSNLDVRYNSTIAMLTHKDSKWNVNGEKYDLVIYTGDVTQLDAIVPSTYLIESFQKIKSLPYNGTSNYLCWCDQTDLSWLYIPEDFTMAHRIIFTGNFSTNNNPYMINRSTCVVEFSGMVTSDQMKSELRLLPFNLEPIEYNYTSHSYVIQRSDTRDNVAALKESLEKYSFYLSGRFAEWEYYNMDKAIEASMNLFNKIQNEG
jgi:protoporphyrinogen oxidase